MVFGNKKSNTEHVQLNGISLDRVAFTKFLGVIIDNQLHWNKHIQIVRGKIAKTIGIMYKIRKIVDNSMLLMVYNSLICLT